MKSVLLMAGLGLLASLTGCASYESRVRAALQLPPDECYEAMRDAWKSDGAWGIDRPESTYDYNEALCYKDKPGREIDYQVHMGYVAEHGGYQGNASTGSSGLSLSTIASTLAAGAAIGAAANGRGSPAAVSMPVMPSSSSTRPAPQATSSQYLASNSAGAANSQQSTPSQTASPGGSAGKTYRTATACVNRDQKSNSLGDFWENHCSFPVWISWFSDDCKNGCAAGPIQPGSKESTTKSRGSFRFAACEYPATPKNTNRTKWTGAGAAYCTN